MTKTDIGKQQRKLAALGENCCKKTHADTNISGPDILRRFGSKKQIFGVESQANDFQFPYDGRMGNFVFVCPSTNLNVQHRRDGDNKNVCDNEYEAIMCKACVRGFA